MPFRYCIPWKKPNSCRRESSVNAQNVSLKEEYNNLRKKESRVNHYRLLVAKGISNQEIQP